MVKPSASINWLSMKQYRDFVLLLQSLLIRYYSANDLFHFIFYPPTILKHVSVNLIRFDIATVDFVHQTRWNDSTEIKCRFNFYNEAPSTIAETNPRTITSTSAHRSLTWKWLQFIICRNAEFVLMDRNREFCWNRLRLFHILTLSPTRDCSVFWRIYRFDFRNMSRTKLLLLYFFFFFPQTNWFTVHRYSNAAFLECHYCNVSIERFIIRIPVFMNLNRIRCQWKWAIFIFVA